MRRWGSVCRRGSAWRGCSVRLWRSLRFSPQPRGRRTLFRTQRLGGYHVLRGPPIRFGIRALVDPGSLHVLRLETCRSRMPLALGNPLLGSGGVLNTAWTAVIGNAVVVDDRVSLHNRPVNVGGMDDGLIHVHDRGVIGKLAAAPLAAGKADAPVAEAVVHAPVVAYVAAPIALMEPILSAGPAPVVGCPQRALIGSRYPCAGHPVVVPVAIGPIARRPHQVGLGADALFIHRQHRRSKSDTDDDLRVGRGGNQREKQRQQEPTRRAEHSHGKNLLALSCLLRLRNRFARCGARAWVVSSQTTPSPLPVLFKTAQEDFCASVFSNSTVSSGS